MDRFREKIGPCLFTSSVGNTSRRSRALNATSTGAGSASRHSIGTGVIGGMLAATFIAVFFVPLFFRLLGGHRSARSDTHMPATGTRALDQR